MYYEKFGFISEIVVLLHTLGYKIFGPGQKVLSLLAWSKFWPILTNQETLTDFHGDEEKKN